MSHLSLCLLPTLNDCSSPAAELHDLLRVFIRPDGFRPLCLVITFYVKSCPILLLSLWD